MNSIKTPLTDPNHDTVGCCFRAALDGKTYWCESHDPSCGFWIQEVGNPSNRRNISERAIGRTVHKLYNRPRSAEAPLK